MQENFLDISVEAVASCNTDSMCKHHNAKGQRITRSDFPDFC